MENLDKDFKKLAKKTKNRKRLISAGISVVATAAVLTGAVLARNSYVKQAYTMASVRTNITLETMSPNRIGVLSNSSQGLFGGSYSLSNFANVDGYPVAVGNWATSYGQNFNGNPQNYSWGADSTIFSIINSNIEPAQFSTGQKNPTFYTPGQSIYSTTSDGMPPQELKTLTQLPKYLAEVAITFDKPYTYAQIQKMIPYNLLTNWCWLTVNAKKSNSSTSNMYIGLSTNIDTYAVGSPIRDDKGNTIVSDNRNSVGNITAMGTYGLDDELYNDFVDAIKKANTIPDLKNLGFGSSDTSGNIVNDYPYQDALKSVKAHPTLDTAKFSGVILTGRTENFAQLEGKSWIYASSVGATTPVLPYLSPVK